MSDPSLLVTNASRSDPELAPPGRHTYYVLFPTPHGGPGRGGARIDWERIGPRYREEIVATLHARGYIGFGDGVEVERLVTPADWAAAGMAAGTPFAAAHTLRQTGPFRPGNLAPGLENVVFVGSNTQPGVGMPMVLVSGRLAAERITRATTLR
jgi:phytoene desaturase